ncbi:MAG TPA: DUF6510 family protein [Chloroflexota bacterium]|nr:DUF6510 family protein [Chloroflexota bacterium]
MNDHSLDGNAMAGLLGEIFPFEMTSVRALCAGCGAMEALGRESVYADAPGMVMRCLHCEAILIRAVEGGGRIWIDMRGVACLQVHGE